MLFSAGLGLLVATNVMSVHSQYSKCDGSRISVATHHRKVALEGEHVQLAIISPRVLHFSAFIILKFLPSDLFWQYRE